MMKNLNYIFICLFISFMAFIGFNINGFCQALPSYDLNSEAFQVLQGQGGVSPQNFFVANPDMAVYMLDQGLEDLRWQIYDNTGVDPYDYDPLEMFAKKFVEVQGNKEWGGLSNVIAGIANGKALEEIILNGYNMFQFGKNGIKGWIMGVKDDATSKIVETTGKAIYLFNSTFMNSMSQSLQTNVEDNNISDYSADNLYYGKEFLVYQYKSGLVIPVRLTFNRDVFLFSSNSESLLEEYFIYSLNSSTLSGTATDLTNNRSSSISVSFSPISNGVYRNNAFSFDGWSFAVKPYFTNGMSESEFVQYLSTFVNSNSAVSFSPLFDFSSILNQLLNKYITSDDLGRIVTFIHDFPVQPEQIVNPDTGLTETVPTVKPSDEQLQSLLDLIDEISDKSELLAPEIESLPDPQPLPDPEPAPNLGDSSGGGTDVPIDFPTGPVFDPLVDIVKTPFSFFSIFEPIFQVFGASFNFFTVWLCFPVILIILLIIWALK